MTGKETRNTPKYRDVFIDFDDTLYDTRGNAQLAIQETFAYFHLERYFPDPQQFFCAYWQANEMLWRRYSLGQITRDHLILQRFRIPLSQGLVEGWLPFSPSTAFCLKVSDWFINRCSDKPGLVPGARELVDYLRGRGYRLHVCSNGFAQVQYRKLNACGLRRAFDTIILSEDAGVNKPDRGYFDYAFRVSGADPAATVMIGDNPLTDIFGARSYGLDAIFYNPNHIDINAVSTPATSKTNQASWGSLREVSDLVEIMDIL